MKVFVTGHKGYIGAHLIEVLKESGHHVVGCDIDYFHGCNWEGLTQPDGEIIGDYLNLQLSDLEGFDCVMHLAAISNDPMGELDEQLTYKTNRDGSIRLAKLAKEAGVSRYMFSSSCSIYGQGKTLDLDETAVFSPVSAYAHSKIQTEFAVRDMADENFSPVFLRNSTAYGHSKMLRLDLVANNLLASAVANNSIRVMSDGSPWRPLIHCRDIARAFCAIMEKPRELTHNTAINIGNNNENYQVKNVVDLVNALVPSANVIYTGEVGADPRNYKVNFDLLGRLLPDFKLQYSLQSGLDELYSKFVEHKFSAADIESGKFIRLKVLNKRLFQ